jgi:hypothetical protein
MPIELKIPPPLEVIKRSDSGNRGGQSCVQGERRGRDQRAQTGRFEHSGHQPTDWLRPQNDQQVFVGNWQASLWAEVGSGQQAGTIQAVSEGAIAGRGLERPGIAARTSGAQLQRRLLDSDQRFAGVRRSQRNEMFSQKMVETLVGFLHPPVDREREAVLVLHKVRHEGAWRSLPSIQRCGATWTRKVRHIRMAADEFEAERQKIRGHNIEGRSQIPELQTVLIAGWQEPGWRRREGQIASRVGHGLGTHGPCQVVVVEPDAVGKGRSQRILLAARERVYAAPLGSPPT